MTVNIRRLAKNTGALMISQVISWSVGMVVAFLIPRYLGPNNFGRINVAGSLWVIVGIFAVFGMDTLLTKTIARTPEELNLLFNQTIFVRLFLFLIGTLGLFIYIYLAGYDKVTVILILIAGIHTFTGLFNGAISASIQGLERMDILASIDIVTKILATALIITAVVFKAGVYFIQFILGIGFTISFILLIITLIRIHPLIFKIKIQPAKVKWLLTAGADFFLLYILINLYHQIDVIALSWFIDIEGVGFYSAADKLIGTLMFVPTTFMLVFFPTFSRLHLEDPEVLRKIFFKAFNLMLLLGIAVGFGVYAISNQVISLFYGSNYLKSITVLDIRGVTLVFTYLNILMGMYLMTIDRQKKWLVVVGLATMVTIPLDLIMVPLSQELFRNGAMGGAISSVITEFGMVIAAIILIPSGILGIANVWYSIRSVIAGAGMVFCVFLFGNGILPLQITIGVVSFCIFAYILRLISPDEVNLVKSGMNSFLSKIQRKSINPVH